MLIKSEMQKEVDLIRSIVKTKHDLKMANRNFEFADSNLIDYYIYQMKANQAKLDYLIKLAKSKGISLDLANSMKFELLDNEEEVV